MLRSKKKIVTEYDFLTGIVSNAGSLYFQFLGDEETVKKAIESVAAQGKAKKWTFGRHQDDKTAT